MMVDKDSKLVRNDILLILIVVIIAGVIYMFSRYSASDDELYVYVRVDGRLVESRPLAETAQFDVEGYQGGYNRIVIKDGSVSVVDADCRDEICVKTGSIQDSTNVIVCLPHRLTVEVNGKGN